MDNFLIRKISRGNLNDAISLVETDVIFKVASVSANKIASFRLSRKIFFKRKQAMVISHFGWEETENKTCNKLWIAIIWSFIMICRALYEIKLTYFPVENRFISVIFVIIMFNKNKSASCVGIYFNVFRH